jgi:type VI secretion system protein
MALRLAIVSEHAARLGPQASKVFGVHGGSIGRSKDNEWILPDPDRYLSGKHARIDFRAGKYVLVDTSSNGTYVNGAQVPLGKYHDYTLKDGDYVRVGEYEVLVSIDSSNDFPPEEGAIVAYDGHSPSAAAKKSTADDIGADLDLSVLLEPSVQLDIDSGIRPHNAYGQSPMASSDTLEPSVRDRRQRELLPREPAPRDAAAHRQEPGGAPWHMLTRPFRLDAGPPMEVPLPGPPGANTTLHDGDFDVGLAALCRGAGIDPRSIAPEMRGAVLQLAGQLLRESLLGLMDMSQGREEFQSRFRIAAEQDSTSASALNFANGVGDALLRLLTTKSTRVSSVEAVRDSFRDAKAQNASTLSAMHAAFEEFLARLDPKSLEERFEKAAKRGVFGAAQKGRYWDLYTELFAGLAQRPADGFPHLFIETFAKAYDTTRKTLIPPKRSGFGGERAESSPSEAKGT